MGKLLNMLTGKSEPEAERSRYLGQLQRNEDNRAGGEGRGRPQSGHHSIWGGKQKEPAKDQESFVKGYKEHGSGWAELALTG